MTSLEKLVRANRWRIRKGVAATAVPSKLFDFGSNDEDGWNGHFLVPLEGELWHVILSDGCGWKHLSASNAQKKQLPSWQVMCRLKEAFFGDDEWCAQFHPAKEDYINDHPYCLHLWMPLNEPLPRPPVIMV